MMNINVSILNDQESFEVIKIIEPYKIKKR